MFRNIRDDIEQEDVEEAFYRYMEENPMAGVYMEDDEIVEYDEVCFVRLFFIFVDICGNICEVCNL